MGQEFVTGGWRRWLRGRGLRPSFARKWSHPDEEMSSGAVRADDGSVWAWKRQDGEVEVWPADGDLDWDQPHMDEDGMLEASGFEGCVRIMDAPDPWEPGGDPARADDRRDRGLRQVFG